MSELRKRDECREKTIALENALRAFPAEVQIEPVIRHYFAGGVYAREMTASAGLIAVGKIIKVDNISTISKGEVSILTPDGVMRVKAPYTWVAPAGTKRAAYFHEETVWTVYHATESTDLEIIEKQVIAETFNDPELLHLELLQLLGEGE